MGHVYKSRLSKIEAYIEERGHCAAIVEGQSNVAYFTGYRGAGYLVHVAGEGAKLVVPMLEYLNAYDALASVELEDVVEVVVAKPYPLPRGMAPEMEGFRVVDHKPLEAVAKLLGDCSSVAAAVYYTDTAEALSTAAPGAKLDTNLRSEVEKWRSVKEPWEVEHIKKALRITENAFMEAVSQLDYGVSEAELAGIIEYSFRLQGSEGVAFPTIVAFGANTVYPHASPSQARRLTRPTPVLIDLGARYEGYASDMTRTIYFGSPDQEFRSVAEAVREALLEAVDKVSSGVEAGEVDAAARRVLERYGLSSYFIHSLGHGVGLDVHERPRVSHSSKEQLVEGMVITVEPGVYLRGKFGVRIENVVLVAKRKAQVLTALPEDLWV
ncbi:MAG: Xaa-Pro peptidase family protein [Thermoproteota archaeon]